MEISSPMRSFARITSSINLPLVEGEFPMIPFHPVTLAGLRDDFKEIAAQMLVGLSDVGEVAYFTLHGRKLRKGDTLRRGGPHTDGNYEPINMTFGGGGWKVGQNGPPVGSDLHRRQYITPKGGILLASNFPACHGWLGEYDGLPSVGGDCRAIKLDTPFVLEPGKVYYGNNHFIHESLPMSEDRHRVLARITLPETHCYQG